MTELLNCPFCDSEAVIAKQDCDDPKWFVWIVACTHGLCECQQSALGNYKKDKIENIKAEVIKIWNTRKPQSPPHSLK